MKILKLVLENLASLKGAYEIDFEAIENDGGGVYAICGPTGSGKSTILDAICLALYGQTPRLQGNIGSDYEAPVMSRGSSECRAVVEFALKGHRYRSSWRQYRARGKADGKLQAPQVELARLDEPAEILTAKKQEHRDKMIQLTGLDFSRFTKVVMLAQGQFQNFLKLDHSDRGELLEKITGTEIYSEISRQVFQITAEYQQKRKALEDELARLRGELGECGTAEDMNELSRKLSAEAEELNRQQALQQKVFRWQEDCLALRGEEQALLLAEAENAPQKEQLAQARNAEQVYARAFILLHQKRENRRTLEQNLQQRSGECSRCRTEFAELEKNREALQKNFGILQEEWQALKEKLPEVRRLDARIEAESQMADRESRNLNGQEKALQRCYEEQQQGIQAEKTLAEDEEKQTQWLKLHGTAEGLTANLEKFAGWLERLQALEAEERIAGAGVEQCRSKAALCREQVLRRQQAEEGLRKELAAVESRLETLALPLAEDFTGEELQNAAELRDGLALRRQNLSQAMDLSRRLQEQVCRIQELNQQLDRLKADAEDALKNYQKCEAQFKTDSSRLDHLRELIRFVNQVVNAEHLRSALQDGRPCPVCGALEHPYAEGTVPGLTDELAECRTLEQKTAELNRRMGELKGRQLLSAEQKLQYEKQRSESEAVRSRLAGELSGAVRSLHCTEEELQLHGGEWLACLDEKLRKVSEFIRLRESLSAEFQQKNLQLHESRNALTEARSAVQLAEAEEKQARAALEKIREEARTGRERYLREAGRYDDIARTGDGMEALAEIQKHLSEICREWREHQSLREEILRKQNAWRGRLEVLNQRLPELEEQMTQGRKSLQEHEDCLAGYRRERTELFGDLKADAEEQAVTERLEKARQNLQKTGADAQNLAGRCREIEQSLQKLQEELNAAQIEADKAEDDFKNVLRQYGFADEDDWSRKRCNTEKMTFLEKLCDGVAKQRTQFQTNQERCLRDEQNLPPELKKFDHENLREKIGQDDLLYREKQQQMGRLQEQMELIDKKGRDIFQKEKMLAQAQEICDKWQDLNAMIGSGGGDKFRRIVQGMTLDLVLEQANRQLANMMDRYELLRSSVDDEKKCLELRIIDHWQNDSERDIRNISGGEAFVVSLALALGLSALKQGNLHVQSLFLDEGFGSLDEKNLENTIQMLANLNQSGRQIGLISHVEALKESVGTRIEVIPRVGTGVSVLQGIGCTRL